jgi:superfamily II DNA or RNA helicase
MADSVIKELQPQPLSRYAPYPAGIDASRVDAADKILKKGNVAVCKPTRAGFTTSAVIAAERRELKTLVIAPTRNILSQTVRKTVEKVGGLPCDIPGHNQCKYIQEIIKKDPLLKHLPIMMKALRYFLWVMDTLS